MKIGDLNAWRVNYRNNVQAGVAGKMADQVDSQDEDVDTRYDDQEDTGQSTYRRRIHNNHINREREEQ